MGFLLQNRRTIWARPAATQGEKPPMKNAVIGDEKCGHLPAAQNKGPRH
jgi:hypothetical protein